MQSWLSFWNTLFWITLFIFLFNKSNFLDLLLFSEIVWVVLYVVSIFYGSLTDDITLYTLSFFVLALAGLEFCIGILILVLFKNFKLDFNFLKNTSTWDHTLLSGNKPIFLNKVFFAKI